MVRSKDAGRCLGLVRGGMELENLGRIVTNRAMFDYFRGSSIVKNHKLNHVIAHHCLSIEFIRRVESSEPEDFQDEFANELWRMNEFSNADARGKQIGESDVYDVTKTNWENVGKGPPGAGSKDNARTTNGSSWGSSVQQERGKGKEEMGETQYRQRRRTHGRK